MTSLGPKSEAALRAGMARLLDGRPERTDGALTVSNLAREAGVSRATANRAIDLLAEFRAGFVVDLHRANTAIVLRADHAHSFRAVAGAVADFCFFFAEDHAVLRFAQVRDGGCLLGFSGAAAAAFAGGLFVGCGQGADACVGRRFGELVDAFFNLVVESEALLAVG